MKIKLWLFLFILNAFCSNIYADEICREEGARLNLSATEMTAVDQDLLLLNMRYEIDANSSSEVQNKINQIMTKALHIAEDAKNIDVSTENYSVYKYIKTDEKGQNGKEIWRGQQSLILKSKAFEDCLNLVQDLQKVGLIMSDMHHEVSVEKIDVVKASLIENALNKLMERAKKIAAITGTKQMKIKNLNVEGDNYYSAPYPKMMMRAANVNDQIAAPVSAPGKTQISLTVSASFLLTD